MHAEKVHDRSKVRLIDFELGFHGPIVNLRNVVVLQTNTHAGKKKCTAQTAQSRT